MFERAEVHTLVVGVMVENTEIEVVVAAEKAVVEQVAAEVVVAQIHLERRVVVTVVAEEAVGLDTFAFI